MERIYNPETNKHELIVSGDELELLYRGLKALEGAALLQESVTHPTHIETTLLREMRQTGAEEGYR